jgi:hypothetical protein
MIDNVDNTNWHKVYIQYLREFEEKVHAYGLMQEEQIRPIKLKPPTGTQAGMNIQKQNLEIFDPEVMRTKSTALMDVLTGTSRREYVQYED